MRIGKRGMFELQEDLKLLHRLDGDNKKKFLNFLQDASTSSPTSEWGKSQRASAYKDMFLSNERVGEYKYEKSLIGSNFVDLVIAKIDSERGVSPSDDVAPGIIREDSGYRCSVGTPHGYIKNRFLTLLAAKQWVKLIRDQYKDYCHD